MTDIASDYGAIRRAMEGIGTDNRPAESWEAGFDEAFIRMCKDDAERIREQLKSEGKDCSQDNEAQRRRAHYC